MLSSDDVSNDLKDIHERTKCFHVGSRSVRGREIGSVQNMMGGMNLGDIQKYLQGVNFPADKNSLVSAMQGNGAPGDILEKVRGANKGQFNGPEDVMAVVQGQ